MMKKKVLFLDTLTFDSTNQVGAQKYARLFSKDNYDVFSLSHYLNLYTFMRKNADDRAMINCWQKKVQQSREGIYFYSPLCLVPYMNLPLLDSMRLARCCLNFCVPDLKKILKSRDFIDIDILFIHNIRALSILRFVKPRKIIFRVYDKIEEFPNQPSNIAKLKNEAIHVADVVYVTSQNLQKEVARIHKKSYYLPNGVDRDFIMNPGETYPYPEEFRKIEGPVAIYIGAVSDWFDYEIFEYGLNALKDVMFVMIGAVAGVHYKRNLSKIEHFSKSYRNFHFLGPRKHSDLKKFLAYADVGIIPFKINELTNEINPVKMFEYASYGVPIVASAMTEMRNYQTHAALYKDEREYVEMIEQAMNCTEQLKMKLVRFAHENTWERRYTKIISTIAHC